MNSYLGIDVGTTNLKVMAFDENGDLISAYSEPTPCRHLGNRSAEMDPNIIWRMVKKGLKCVCGSVEGTIRSVGVSSMGESGILCDEAGQPLYPFIIWYDVRPQKVLEKFMEHMSPEEVFLETGQIPAVKYGLMKLLWIKEQYPKLYSKAAHWLSVEDWILYCLTGKYATDYSIAARTMAFNPITKDWSDKMLSTAGVERNLFPKPYPGGTQIGTIRPELAEEVGLASDTIVSTGGHDHACAAIAVNILENNCVLDSMGTAEVLMTASEKPLLYRTAFENQYCVYPHCGERLYRIVTSNQSCGACIEWYLDTFGKLIRRDAEASEANPYELLTEIAAEMKNDSSEVFFLPFIRGSVESEFIKGTFIGLYDHDTESDYIRAVFDGLGYEIRTQIEGFHSLTGNAIEKVKVVGGPSKSSYIMKRKALTQNCDIQTPVCPEAAAKGAALLGAIAREDYTFRDLERLYQPGSLYKKPEKDVMHKNYQRYRLYRNGMKDLYLADGLFIKNNEYTKKEEIK